MSGQEHEVDAKLLQQQLQASEKQNVILLAKLQKYREQVKRLADKCRRLSDMNSHLLTFQEEQLERKRTAVSASATAKASDARRGAAPL